VKIKLSEATPLQLNWLVAKAHNFKIRLWKDEDGYTVRIGIGETYAPSTDWAQGGPIIEREDVSMIKGIDGQWKAAINEQDYSKFWSKTPLIAAMLCFVTSKLGDEVEVPDELL